MGRAVVYVLELEPVGQNPQSLVGLRSDLNPENLDF